MAMAGRGDQFLSLGLCLEMSICVVAVAGSLIPAVPDAPAATGQIDPRSPTVLPALWSPAELLKSLFVAALVPRLCPASW